MKKYPNIRNAEKIWREGIKYRELNFDFNEKDVYIFHSRGVAYCCQEIAKKTKELDEDKAYVLGLLHDYGKRQPEKLTGRFHGLEIMNSGLEHHSSGRAYFRAGNPHEALRICGLANQELAPGK